MSESFGQSFEYDEDTEADEGSDEADEADEGADEADEAFEASDEGSDEADEGSGEADEGADEAMDEAMSASARLSARIAADRDRQARERWASRLASDRRREAQAASAVQQSLTSRLRDIRGSGQTRTMTVGNLNGVRTVKLQLASGRTAVVQVVPTLASAGEVNRLRAVVNANEKRRAADDNANSRAIGRLASAQASFVKRQTAQQVKSDRELGRRIVEGDTRLDKRITSEVANQKGAIEKNNKRIFRRIKRVRYQLLMNDVLLASALPFFAAYGKQGSPFDKRNLALTGVLGGWLLGDELIGLATGMGKSSKAMNTLTTTWSTLAPIGNGLTDFLLYRNTQNTRFLTGVTTFPANQSGGTITVNVPVASSSAATFNALAEVPVVATIVSTTDTTLTVQATVAKDKLKLTLSKPSASAVDVAWVIDTDPGATPVATVVTTP
jgi:hypothetical protein